MVACFLSGYVGIVSFNRAFFFVTVSLLCQGPAAGTIALPGEQQPPHLQPRGRWAEHLNPLAIRSVLETHSLQRPLSPTPRRAEGPGEEEEEEDEEEEDPHFHPQSLDSLLGEEDEEEEDVVAVEDDEVVEEEEEDVVEDDDDDQVCFKEILHSKNHIFVLKKNCSNVVCRWFHIVSQSRQTTH